MRGSTSLMVAIVALSGCPHGGATLTPPPPQSPLERFAAPPHTVTWHETMFLGQIEAAAFTVRQDWSAPHTIGNRVVYDVTETQIDDGGERVREKLQMFYGPEGYGQFGEYDKGNLAVFDPPEVVLPADPFLGEEWEQAHSLGAGEKVPRSCEIMASSLCPQGYVSVCDTTVKGHRAIMRDHFCPNVGWSGFETLILVDQGDMRIWTDHVVKDGVVQPDPPEEQ